jgi:lipoprotein-anchoring transpeptidase ErfK/SrfK
MANKTTAIESLSIVNGKDFSVFYTTKKDKDVTALASYYGRKILTERLIAISGGKENPKVTTLTKVTLLKKVKQ